MRIAAIEVSHWHSLYDSAYLRHLAAMPDVQLVGVQDPSADLAAQRVAALGGPPVFTDYSRMLEETRPDFVVALGRHSAMAHTANYLLDTGYPFLMEKPMGINADRGARASPTRPRPSAPSSRCRSPSATSRSPRAPGSSSPRGDSGRCPTSTSA